MTKHLLIGAALAVVLVTTGVIVGRQADTPAAVPPVVTPPSQPAPTLKGHNSEDDRVAELITRVARLEDAVEALRRSQEGLAKDLGPAADLVKMFTEMRPRLKTARKSANQTAAIATLRNFISAQAQIQQSGKIDLDNDGTGEYAGFLEMSGGASGRMGAPLVPPVLSGAFRVLNANGEAMRSGYHYRIYLPDGRGMAVGEPGGGFAPNTGVEPDLAETTWCCYAWPVNSDASGSRVFFTNQAGDVLATESDRYVGAGRGPSPDAAFTSTGILGRVAVGQRGRDGNVWKQVN